MRQEMYLSAQHIDLINVLSYVRTDGGLEILIWGDFLNFRKKNTIVLIKFEWSFAIFYSYLKKKVAEAWKRFERIDFLSLVTPLLSYLCAGYTKCFKK